MSACGCGVDGARCCCWPLCQPAAVQQQVAALTVALLYTGVAPFRCAFCGAPSWVLPEEQVAPSDYCHPEDHGSGP
jgi:hypothetical protein